MFETHLCRLHYRGSPADCKKLAYISLVRSGMEYASIIWDPYTKADSNKLEKNSTYCHKMATFIIFVQNQCHFITPTVTTEISEERPKASFHV